MEETAGALVPFLEVINTTFERNGPHYLAGDCRYDDRGKCGALSTASGSPCQVRVSPYGYDYCKEHGGWEYEGMWPLETGAFCARCIMLPFWPVEFQVKCPACLS